MGEGRVGNGFYNPFAGIGNCRMLCGMGMRRDREKEKTYVERALDKGNRYEGFVYETAAVSGEMDEVRRWLPRTSRFLRAAVSIWMKITRIF